MKDPDQAPEDIKVTPAAAGQEQTLANLLELYAYDFSEFHPLEIGVDGRFGYKPLSLYWIEAGRHPFLVTVNDKLAGLVLVTRGSEFSENQNVWDMAEFFILRGYRRRGIGTRVAHQVGGSSRVRGRFVRCRQMLLRKIFGRRPSRASPAKQFILPR